MTKGMFVFVLHAMFVATVLGALNYVLPSSISEYYKQAAGILLFIHISSFTYEFARNIYVREKINSMNKAVLITGCDSGFGHEIAKRLDRLGFKVFASCLIPSGSGATALKEVCSDKLRILELDVTKDDSVESAADFVKKNLDNCELWAVINNAGILKGFTFDLTDMSGFKDTMEVNTFGAIRVTKAFLPLLRRSKGRVINMTSLAGRIAVPCLASYCISKFAAVAFSECLKQEMKIESCGIKVISIEPEFFRTQLFDPELSKKRIEELIKSRKDEIQQMCDEKFMSQLQEHFKKTQVIGSKDISPVIEDLVLSVSLKNPASVYRPCRSILAQIIYYIFLHAPFGLFEVTAALFLYLTGCPIFHNQAVKGPQSRILFMENACKSLLVKLLYYCRLHQD